MKKVAWLLLLVPAAAAGKIAPPLRNASPDLEVATSNALKPLLTRIARTCPGAGPVHVAALGSDVAMAALYTHRADLAIIGRQAADPEAKAFEWIWRRPPFHWLLMGGSLDQPGKSPAIRLMVNAANPVQSIDLRDLQRIYRGRAMLTWGDLGVKGRLARQPVRPILPDTEQGTGRFLRDAVFDHATTFAWGRVREVTEGLRGNDGPRRIATLVAQDKAALALVSGPARVGTRSVTLTIEGRPSNMSSARIADQSYPLSRAVYGYSNVLSDPARAFLLCVLADRSRPLVARDGFISLSPDLVSAERPRLEQFGGATPPR